MRYRLSGDLARTKSTTVKSTDDTAHRTGEGDQPTNLRRSSGRNKTPRVIVALYRIASFTHGGNGVRTLIPSQQIKVFAKGICYCSIVIFKRYSESRFIICFSMLMLPNERYLPPRRERMGIWARPALKGIKRTPIVPM